MKHAGLFAFGLTTCVLVPAAMHVLGAGPKQVARLVAPPTSEITLNGADVTIAADKKILGIGDKLHVTVTAKAEGRKKVRVALLAFESTGTGGGRVETPPIRIGRGEVTLDTVHGEAVQTFAFTLPGDREYTMESGSGFTHYRVLAMSPEEADRLERRKRKADRVENPMSGDNVEDLYSFTEAYNRAGIYDDDAPHTVGRLDVTSRAKGGAIAISVPDTAKVGDDIAVVVTLKNKGKHDAKHLAIKLSAEANEIGGEWLGMTADTVAIADPERTVDVAKGETATLTFHVKAAAAGTLGLFASSYCGDEGCYEVAQAVDDSALDAIEIVPAEKPPQLVDL